MSKIRTKIKDIYKDDSAFASAPVILVIVLLFIVMTMIFIGGFVSIGNAQMLKQEILNETSYFNSELASIRYNYQSQGHTAYMGENGNISSYSEAYEAVAKQFERKLCTDLQIEANGIYPEKEKIRADSVDVRITDIDESTNTVKYVIEMKNVYYIDSISLTGEYKIGTVKIKGSYTFNGDEDIDDNNGTVIRDRWAEETTNATNNNIIDNLPGLEQNEADDNLIH